MLSNPLLDNPVRVYHRRKPFRSFFYGLGTGKIWLAAVYLELGVWIFSACYWLRFQAVVSCHNKANHAYFILCISPGLG